MVHVCARKSRSLQDVTISSSTENTACMRDKSLRTVKSLIIFEQTLTLVLIGNNAMKRLLRLLFLWTSTTVRSYSPIKDGGLFFKSDQTTWISSTIGHLWNDERKTFNMSFRRKVLTLGEIKISIMVSRLTKWKQSYRIVSFSELIKGVFGTTAGDMVRYRDLSCATEARNCHWYKHSKLLNNSNTPRENFDASSHITVDTVIV